MIDEEHSDRYSIKIGNCRHLPHDPRSVVARRGHVEILSIRPARGEAAQSSAFGEPASRRAGNRGKAVICFDRRSLIEDKPPMAKKPGTNPKGEFAFFNVVYEDGSQRSNRRVPAELLGGLDGDEPARGFIIEQDREIAEKAGRPPLAIKTIERVGAKKK
ncbi:hypothetical protein ACVJGD_007190 [Bradyrhizobium sp. USDA 10063]